MLLCYQLLWFSLFPIRINFEGLVIFLCEPLSLLLLFFFCPVFFYPPLILPYVWMCMWMYMFISHIIFFLYMHTQIHAHIYSSYRGRMRDSGSQEFLWCGLKVKYFFYHFVDIYLIFFLFRRSWEMCIMSFFDTFIFFRWKSHHIIERKSWVFLCITSPSDGKNL